MKAQIRRAVGVVMTPDPGSSEVFIVERSPELRFFGGFHAFPGGTLDAGDEAGARLVGADGELGTARYAALRELFEETGVLPGAEAVPADELAAARGALLAGGISFAALVERLRLRDALDLDALATLCTITTPPFAPVRFATRFFWCQLPAGQRPTIVRGELVDGRFRRAEEALGLWRDGGLALAPPVLLVLERLAGCSVESLGAALDGIDEERGTAPGDAPSPRRIFFSPGVQMIPLATRTRPPATHTNCYLVGERELYVVDPAPVDPAEQETLWRSIEDRVAAGGVLRGILLTHEHPDHVGAVTACHQRYRVPVMAHPATLAPLPAFESIRPLADGTAIELGESPDGRAGWRLEVFHTPGHAPGHLVFRESRYHALLAGDLVSTISTIVIDPAAGGDLATYLRSLERIAALELGTLYPAHGPAAREAAPVLRRYLAHRREREQQLVAALREQPRPLAELLAEVYADTDRALWPLAERSLAAGIEKLVAEGVCEKVGEGYRRRPTA